MHEMSTRPPAAAADANTGKQNKPFDAVIHTQESTHKVPKSAVGRLSNFDVKVTPREIRFFVRSGSAGSFQAQPKQALLKQDTVGKNRDENVMGGDFYLEGLTLPR